MLESVDIDRIAHKAAAAALKDIELVTVHSEPAIGSEGEDALLVTIVFRPGREEVSGDAVVDALVGIRQDLVHAGEERFPIVDFATEEEMMQVDDGP